MGGEYAKDALSMAIRIRDKRIAASRYFIQRIALNRKGDIPMEIGEEQEKVIVKPKEIPEEQEALPIEDAPDFDAPTREKELEEQEAL